MTGCLLGLVFLLALASFPGCGSQGICPVIMGDLTVASGNQSLVVSWPPVSGLNVSEYRVFFGVAGSSVEKSAHVPLDVGGSGRVSYTLPGLRNFTSYDVRVGVVCVGDGGEVIGVLNSANGTTRPAVPTGRVDGLTFVVVRETPADVVVNITWSPLPEDQWNAIPLGYYVYILRHADQQQEVHRVSYPSTSVIVGVVPGLYDVHIVAVNTVGPSPDVREEGRVFWGAEASGTFADYPYFYILIPGVIFLVVIVVIIIVIVKKVLENKKRSVTFVRDIDNGSITHGFGNAVQMRDLSPHSPNTSASIPMSSTVTSPAFSIQQQQQQHGFHQHLANRPLPLSPNSGPSHHPAEEYPPVFTVPPDSATYREIPNQLPMVEEGVAHRVPMSRTMTDPNLGAVFSPVSPNSVPPTHQIHGPAQQGAGHGGKQQGKHLQQRGRSNTVAGLPSPYEVPDTNNGAPNNDAFRPNSAHPQRAAAAGGAMIPPPPTHSPPPFNHSATDLPGDHAHNQPHPRTAGSGSQNTTLPRTAMPNQRSLSTSAAQGRSIAGKGGMPYIKSEGNIHDPEGVEDFGMPPHMEVLEGDDSVYTEPGVPEGIHLSLERGRAPPPHLHHQHHHHHHHHHPHPPQQQRPRHPGMINGALATSDQFDQFGITGEGPIPPSMQTYPMPPGGGDRDLKRESLFSETSTELSMSSSGDPPHQRGGAGMMRGGGRMGSVHTDTSSNSDKEFSPGWDYPRGGKSDVSHQHSRGQRSRSPPEREHEEIKEFVV